MMMMMMKNAFALQSISLDKMTGKRCYMLSAKELLIIYGKLRRSWQQISLSKSRLVPFSYFVIFFIFSFHARLLILLMLAFLLKSLRKLLWIRF